MPHTEQQLADFKDFLEKKCGYPYVKLFPEAGTYGAICKLMFHYTLLTGEIGDCVSCDRWCFTANVVPVIAALEQWDGKSEPVGWQRHPATGRRRLEADPKTEYIAF